MRRVTVAVLIAVTIGMGIAGCGRFDRDGDPVPVASTPASSDSTQDVIAELDSIDDTLTQTEQDAVAGDEAARTDDAP